MANNTPFDLLVGVGKLYIAPASTAMPTLGSTPGGTWREVGDTDGGVKITKTQNIELFSTDQTLGNLKAVRTEESVVIETDVIKATLENFADFMGGTVTTVAPGASTIGTKSLGMYAGADPSEFAVLFTGYSPYGNWPAQYYIPRAIFNDDIEWEYTKDDMVKISIKLEALVDTAAVTAANRFGTFVAQHAAATG